MGRTEPLWKRMAQPVGGQDARPVSDMRGEGGGVLPRGAGFFFWTMLRSL